MLRTLMASLAVVALCFTLGACEKSSGEDIPAPKGGAKRPPPETAKSPPGSGGGEGKSGISRSTDPEQTKGE